MSNQDTVAVAPDEPTVSLTLPIDGELPEYVQINGVDYGRLSDNVDEVVHRIRDYQLVAKRAGVSLRQAVWFSDGHSLDEILPD